ncbi:MAG: hypothetical protein ABH846_04015 [Patescibacteria group bacterium]
MTATLELPGLFDGHVHLRWDARTAIALPHTLRQFVAAVIMPNTAEKRIIRDVQDATDYEQFLRDTASHHAQFSCNPVEGSKQRAESFKYLMTLYLTDETTPEDLEELHGHIVSIKVFLKGTTTGSGQGISNLLAPHIITTLKKAADLGMPVSFHGEIPEGFPLDRVSKFLVILRQLLEIIPNLKVIIEHLSSAEEIAFIKEMRQNGNVVYGTITLHHMLLTLEDLMGGGLNPHHHFFPCAKRPEDREAIRQAAFAAEPWCFFGSDSAPHFEANKLRVGGAGGVFSAPVLVPKLVAEFEASDPVGWQGRLLCFARDNGRAVYKIDLPATPGLKLVKESWFVPSSYPGTSGAIVPFLAGQEIPWRIV